jgi:hypothetical protein
MSDPSDDDIQARAIRLLEAIRSKTEKSRQPVFVSEIAHELQMDQAAAEGAFRYLAGKRLVDTFSIPYTGRINAAGHDALTSVRQLSNGNVAPPSAQPMQREDNPETEPNPDAPMEWDVFISHASEDKNDFVRQLADHLRRSGLRVWFDELTLTVGDSLRRSIDRGLSRSRYGIVVISPSFLQKDWPQKELDGLVAREVDGVKVILPVWHNMTADVIRRYSPMLADRLAVSSSKGLDHVTSQLLQAIRKENEERSQITPVAVSAGGSPSPRAASSSLRELSGYAAEFHRRRTELIVAGKPPIAVLEGGALVLHVVPLSALNERAAAAFEDMTREPHYFPPIGTTHGRDYRISYDGLLIGASAEGLMKPQRAYVHVFRSAVVEAVVTSLARGRENLIVLPELQAVLIKFASLYAKSLHHFGVEPPMVVNVSLVNVEGMSLLQDFIGTALPEDLPSGDLDRPLLYFGQATFETVPADYNEGAKSLKPILTHLANAAGLSSSPYFDAKGNYIGNLR